MTNSWMDIANATLIIAWGANPAENHPACIAHVNRARFPKDYFAATDSRYNKKAAKFIVIDPRKSRTAVMADNYVRIRPGTDIAFQNGVMRYMFKKIEAMDSADPVRVAFYSYLNQAGNGSFYTDGANASGGTSALATTVPSCAKYTDARFVVNASGTDYERHRTLASDGLNTTGVGPDSTTISDFPKKVLDVTNAVDPNYTKTVWYKLNQHIDPYTTPVVADICGCNEADISLVGNAIIENSRCSSGAGITDARNPAYRASTILYAMGITQHTCGGQNVKGFAVFQSVMGNMGRAGGGINALRGIHNVQGSTDMGLLYGNIPGYSGNPSVQPTALPDTTNNPFGKYMDALWGLPLSGTGTRAKMDQSYDDAYNTGAMQLQQRGFYNMTLKWFGDYATVNALTGTAKRKAVDACYSLWPKGNGSNHIKMFRSMCLNDPDTARIKAAVVWGQNPAVTEPNQSKIREGLENLDLLVCADMFETETGACHRKGTGLTFLFPAASHVEKAGSATNSGRTLQWRYQALDARGQQQGRHRAAAHACRGARQLDCRIRRCVRLLAHQGCVGRERQRAHRLRYECVQAVVCQALRHGERQRHCALVRQRQRSGGAGGHAAVTGRGQLDRDCGEVHHGQQGWLGVGQRADLQGVDKPQRRNGSGNVPGYDAIPGYRWWHDLALRGGLGPVQKVTAPRAANAAPA